MWKLVGMLPVLWTGSAALSAQTIPFDSGRWEIIADSFRTLDYLGQKALYLRGGFASVKDLEFTDGVVEFDICVSGVTTVIIVYRAAIRQSGQQFEI
jgi:hypothetical protein